MPHGWQNLAFTMVTPLFLQAFELNDLLWRKGPYVQFPFSWNSIQQKFVPETNNRKNLIWVLSSSAPFGIAACDLIFLVTVGLREPHLDSPTNWIATMELLSLALAFFLYNFHMYYRGPACIANYYNYLMEISIQQGKGNRRRKKIKISGKKLMDFVHPVMQGKVKFF